ncbi:MAG TPA: hypothetical protein VLF18_23060 [Tahibacter sp.]|uniref:hypothetical protein n=1 Tax=Tahibacter sp. TaxID=2056211 RepID=UPI002CEE3DED|nr:hypothetical protein [Tahibacter sp.]HSX63078.1 hypothetical protein [Tahibacter sp.]
MTKPSLSELYQSLTADQTLSARALVDADTAVRAAQGRVVPHERDEVASALAGSAAHADLVQFLRALEPASTELAHDLAHGAASHESRGRGRRTASARPARGGWQWGAVAASVVAAIALFVAHNARQPVVPTMAVKPADTIFDARLENGVAHHAADDRIFRSGSDGAAGDRIFRNHAGG